METETKTESTIPRHGMSSEAQRIAIAEACGWTKCQPDQHYGHDRPKGVKPNGKEHHFNNWEWLPDYLNDLNAMHEAEKVLTDEQWSEYTKWILDNTAQYISQSGAPLRAVSMVHATAAQRAEAFLKTLGLWRDDISNLSTVDSTTAQP